MDAHIYASELELMALAMADHPDLETGGALFGLWTHTGAPVIHLATGPGPSARHGSTSFYQDEAYLEGSHRALWEAHGLQHLGEWHSHHHIGLAEPSGGDERTVWAALGQLRWPRFLLGIGNFPGRDEERCDFGFFRFDAATGRQEPCRVRVLDGRSPLRAALPHLPAAAPYRRWRPRPPAWSVGDPQRLPEAWFAAPVSRRRIARELAGFAELRDACGIDAELRVDGDLLLVDVRAPDGRSPRLALHDGFPHRAPAADGLPLAGPWRPDRLLATWVLEALAAEDERARDHVEPPAPPPEPPIVRAIPRPYRPPEPPRSLLSRARDRVVRAADPRRAR